MEATGRRTPSDATMLRWALWVLVAVVALTLAALAATLVVDGYVPSGGEAAAMVAVVLLAAAGPGAVALVVRTLPRRWRPLVLALTVLPAVTATGAAGLPESAIHYSGRAGWALEAGREISLAALVAGGVLAAAVAWAHAYRAAGIAAIVALTLLGGALGRDVAVRAQVPQWCYPEPVLLDDSRAGSLLGGSGSCTLLLPRPTSF